MSMETSSGDPVTLPAAEVAALPLVRQRSCGECPFDGATRAEAVALLGEYPPTGQHGADSCHVHDQPPGVHWPPFCFGLYKAKLAAALAAARKGQA